MLRDSATIVGHEIVMGGRGASSATAKSAKKGGHGIITFGGRTQNIGDATAN